MSEGMLIWLSEVFGKLIFNLEDQIVEEIASVNAMAVVAGTLVSFMIGWFWYSPKCFGTKWAQGSGVSLEKPEKMPMFPMLAQLVSLFLLALVVGVTANANALTTAILAILAAAMVTVSGGAWTNKSSFALGVDFFYIVVSGAVMIAAQGIL
jgi:hypothetical protein